MAATELLNFTDENAKEALIQARGDLFVASQMLGITAVRLNRAIQVSDSLRATVAELRSRDKGEGVSDDDLRKAIDARISLYRVAGLDALHDLATMPIDSNSAQNQVKLAAAARLAGTSEQGGGGGELAETLRELNRQYAETAPRIRVVRERLTVETVPQERAIEGEISPSRE